MERSTIFNGKINYFDWAIFNSELLNYQRVFVQWEFKDPKLEVPTIYKAYFLGLCKGI